MGAGDTPLAGVTVDAMWPVHEQPGVVAYPRGRLVEQYLARQDSLEQQFIIPQPLPLGGADLVIVGAVRSAGTFEETEDGWRRRTPEGAVRLGDVRAYDATGRDLPAAMTVTAAETRIVVDGRALARAAYPVTIDPEIGANDFRLSDMGGDVLFDAGSPAVAYNSPEDEYLVVWNGDDDTAPLVDNEREIFGQRFAVVADLSTTKSDSPDPVDPGATLIYTLSVNNAGPDILSSVTVTDSLPSSVTFVSASESGWTCSHTGGMVTCTANGLAVGSAPDIVVAVIAPASGGTITNTATVGSGALDTNTENNRVTITTCVNYRLYLPLVLR